MTNSKKYLINVLNEHGWKLPKIGDEVVITPEFAQLALLYIIAENE